MNRGNRRRRTRRSGGTRGGVGARRAGRRPGSAGAAGTALARVVEASGLAAGWAQEVGRWLGEAARSVRAGAPRKQGAALGRRVGEVARSLHGRGLMIWAAALATGLLCVWQHVRSSELALEIEALKGRREAVKTEIGLLEMECAELSGRERVEEYAMERLGMRYPRAGEVIWIGPSASDSPIVNRDGYVVREARRETKG